MLSALGALTGIQTGMRLYRYAVDRLYSSPFLERVSLVCGGKWVSIYQRTLVLRGPCELPESTEGFLCVTFWDPPSRSYVTRAIANASKNPEALLEAVGKLPVDRSHDIMSVCTRRGKVLSDKRLLGDLVRLKARGEDIVCVMKEGDSDAERLTLFTEDLDDRPLDCDEIIFSE